MVFSVGIVKYVDHTLTIEINKMRLGTSSKKIGAYDHKDLFFLIGMLRYLLVSSERVPNNR